MMLLKPLPSFQSLFTIITYFGLTACYIQQTYYVLSHSDGNYRVILKMKCNVYSMLVFGAHVTVFTENTHVTE